MRILVLAPVLAVCLLPVTGCDFEDFGDSNRHQENFHHTYPLKAGGRLSIENLNGSVEIFGWDKDSVDISGTKYANTEDRLKSIRIDIQNSADAVRIRTDRPTLHGNYGARFTIYVPRKCELERITSSNGSIRVTDVDGAARLKTSNGSVRATRVGGGVEASTTNGTIEIREVAGAALLSTSNGAIRAEELKGTVEASTTNGSISVEFDKPQQLRAKTTNGSITVRLPESAAARIEASTSNSSITTDFDVRGGRSSKHYLDGAIGAGGPLLDLHTTNGAIRLLRR